MWLPLLFYCPCTVVSGRVSITQDGLYRNFRMSEVTATNGSPTGVDVDESLLEFTAEEMVQKLERDMQVTDFSYLILKWKTQLSSIFRNAPSRMRF